MRLKYLWLENYKNLKDFSIDFSKGDGLTMLIGTNGSGKSNLIEAISAIFAGMQKRNNNPDFAFKIEYVLFSGIEVRINKHPANQTHCYVNGVHKSKKYVIENWLLPSKIIAVYSGDEDRLWRSYYEAPYKSYIKDVGKRNIQRPLQRMQYINKYYWKIALLSLITGAHGEDGLSPNAEWLKQLPLRDIASVNIRFQNFKLPFTENALLDAFLLTLAEHADYYVTTDECRKLSQEEIFTEFGKRIIDAHQNAEPLFGNAECLFIEEQLNSFTYDSKQVFDFFTQAYMPKDLKVIADISIKHYGYDFESLSEGEKRLILVRAVLDVVADQDALVLFDEPDSHIHETRKKGLLDMMKSYTQYGRQIVLTSHSPTLANTYNCEGRIMLERDADGSVKQIPFTDVKAVEMLTDGLWSAVEQNIFFSSTKPLILTEGIGDIRYIKKAIEVLSIDEEKYRKIDCDFLQMGGGGESANAFIQQLKPHVNANKKIVIIFDRDEEGSKGIKSCINTGNDRQHHFGVYKSGNWHYFMLPKTDEHDYKDFMIEDYFTKAYKTQIINSKLAEADGHMNAYEKKMVKEQLKDALSARARFDNYTHADLAGFKVLLDRIIGIMDGTAADIEEV